jgi:hypothetical protein
MVPTSDHLNSNSSIRDRRARIVQLRLNVDSLPLDTHARDKMIRLVGERFRWVREEEEKTIITMLLFRFNEEITLSTDRCPYRGKNEDYCKYFLTALFHEVGSYEDIDSVQDPPPVNINASTSLISNHAMAMQLDRTMNVLRYGMVMDVREFHLGFLKLMVLVKILVRIMLILFLKNLIKNLVSVPDCQDLLTPWLILCCRRGHRIVQLG